MNKLLSLSLAMLAQSAVFITFMSLVTGKPVGTESVQATPPQDSSVNLADIYEDGAGQSIYETTWADAYDAVCS
jgi:hypothetical protein